MRDIFFALFMLGVLALGTAAPFVMSLGYMWIDLLKPQAISYGFFKGIPSAFIFAVATVGMYILADRRSLPKITLIHILMFMFAGWVTVTTYNALYQDWAWWKWDWAFKTIIFACFVPFVIRSRIQLEAMLYVMVVGTMPLVVATGLKTALGGGGYGVLRIGAGNTNLSETSALSMFAAIAIGIAIYLMKHTLIFPRHWIGYFAVLGYAAVCALVTVGTEARTGLVCLGVFAAGFWYFSSYKIPLLGLLVAAVIGAVSYAPDSTIERMQTIMNPTEDASANTRLLVWEWTWDFVKEHPFGGGFVSFLANNDEIEGETRARAFHSIYFEVLGEHGYLGLGIFSALILLCMWCGYGLHWRNKRKPELEWLSDLGKLLLVSVSIFAIGGIFIGIAFQPFLYYFAAIAIVGRSYELKYTGETADAPDRGRAAQFPFSTRRRRLRRDPMPEGPPAGGRPSRRRRARAT